MLGRITDLAGFDDVFAFGQIVEKIVSRGVGRDAVGGAVDRNGRKGEVFAGPAVDDMAEKIGVRGAFGASSACATQARHTKSAVVMMRFMGSKTDWFRQGRTGKRRRTEGFGKRRNGKEAYRQTAAGGARSDRCGGLRRAWRRSEAEHGCRAA